MIPVRDRQFSQGFTLVEVLVALVLMAMLTTLLWQGLSFFIRANERQRELADRGEVLFLAQKFLRDQLEAAQAIQIRQAGRPAAVAFDGRSASVTFVARLPSGMDLPGFYWHQVQTEEVGGGNAIVVRWWPMTAAGGPADADQETLLQGQYGLRFRYRANESEDWGDRWQEADRLPELIELSLLGFDGSPSDWPPVVVRPRIAAGSSCTFDPVSQQCRLD